jgi:hypothetical protein
MRQELITSRIVFFLLLLFSLNFPLYAYEKIVIYKGLRVSEALAEGQRLRSLLVIEDEEALNNIETVILDIESLITYILNEEGAGPSLSRMQALYLGAMTYAILSPTRVNIGRKIYYEILWRQEIQRLEQRNPIDTPTF